MQKVRFTANNAVTLLQCGAEYFPALLAEIDAAEREIYLETYIFADDETGSLVKAALIDAAARGVRVQVITDWIGTGRRQANALACDFLAGGVNYRIFNPWFRRGLARSHRKICVIDRHVALVGGLNINDDMRSDDDAAMILPAPRWDIAVSIRGPLVNAIRREAHAQWLRLGPLNLNWHLHLKRRWELFRGNLARKAIAAIQPMEAALVVRDNLRNRQTIQRAYLKALGGARKTAILANPYFAPGRKLRVALSRAAERGVQVTLLLGVGQFRMQDAVAKAYYPQLLEKGVRIVEYQKTQLHAKVAVIDDAWATVGSSNYDGLSLFVNHEANIVIRDAGFATALREHIETALAEGKPVNPSAFQKIPWVERAWNRFAYFLYKNILHLVTMGKSSE